MICGKCKLLKALFLADLEKEMNELMKNGWEPSGSIVVCDSTDTTVFLQTMVYTWEERPNTGPR